MTPVLAAEAAGVATIVAVVLIVAVLVVYLVAIIWQLRKITKGLDVVIGNVGEIVEKSAPVNDVVTAINEQLDAGVDLLEGLLVKKAGMTDAVGLRRGPLRRLGGRGLQELSREHDDQGAAHRRGLHQGHAHAGATRPGGADRRRQPRRPGAPRRRARQPGRPAAVSRAASGEARVAAEVAGDRHRLAGAVPAERAARRDDTGRGGDARERPVDRSRRRRHRPLRARRLRRAAGDAGGGSPARQPGSRRDDRIGRAGDRGRHRPECGRRGRRDDRRRARAAGGRRARPEGRRRGASSGRRRIGESPRTAPTRNRRRDPVQTPAPFEYERATSVDGAIASLQKLGPERGSSPAGTACCR